MIYTHFGKPADVLKHLVLCEVMKDEQPQIYVETNSACAEYLLSRTPEQQYGIYFFIDKAKNYKELFNSVYFNLESVEVKNNRYLGSPGLAMNILQNSTERFIFFDIEPDPLNNIRDFAERQQLSENVKLLNQDSVIGTYNLLPTLPQSTLIHIDPYEIDKPSKNGQTYFDLFVQATKQGLKCVLWYGFNTYQERERINNYMVDKLSSNNTGNLLCIELIMAIMQVDKVLCNPGVVGYGLLTSNLSETSMSIVKDFSELLTDLYKGSNYNGFKGDLIREIIPL